MGGRPLNMPEDGLSKQETLEGSIPVKVHPTHTFEYRGHNITLGTLELKSLHTTVKTAGFCDIKGGKRHFF